MYGNSYSQDQQPLLYFRGHPVFVAYGLVVAYVLSMLVTAVCFATGHPGLLQVFAFDGYAVLHGQVWRVLTYGMVNRPTIWFAIDMVFIARFGREVETLLGRNKFLALYAGLYLSAPLAYLTIAPWSPALLFGETGALGLFIVFAVFYPNASMFLTGLSAQWFAILYVGLLAVISLTNHDFHGFLSLGYSTGFAFGFARFAQGKWTWPKMPKLNKQVPASRRVQSALARQPALGAASMAEVDGLLDKIAQSGFNSLTVAEKARLDSARAEIRRRSDRG